MPGITARTPDARDRVPAPLYPEWTVERDVFVRMSDGVHLDTDIWFPTGAPHPLPTVLIRTPYDKDRIENQVRAGWVEFFAGQGFAVVVQNERGRFFSEGDYDEYLAGCRRDGGETLDWIVAQPWSNGRVGTIGLSSSADAQLPMAALDHPAHAAGIVLAPGAAVGDIGGRATQGLSYRGGVPFFEFWIWWYSNVTPTERLVLPPATTQAQRNRLRDMYSLTLSEADFWASWPVPRARLEHLPSCEVLTSYGREASPFSKYLTWTPADPGWRDVDRFHPSDSTSVPMLVVDTWHEAAIIETLRWFEHLQTDPDTRARLILGPGGHGVSSNGQLRPSAGHDLTRERDLFVGDGRYRGSDVGYVHLYLDWFRSRLTDSADPSATTDTDLPPVQVYIMRRGWVTGDRWPLEGLQTTTYYLGDESPAVHPANAGSLTLTPPTRDGLLQYVYDPADPTPSLGGDYMATALDQRPVEARADVLTYTTARLTEPLTVVGPISVVLNVSSTATDTDVMVKLTVVEPDGGSILLSHDAFRVRYREGWETPTRMTPGEVYEITLDNLVTGFRFEPGQCIRLDVSSSSFPLFERNLNTGGDNYDETDYLVARNSVHHGAAYPSRLILPTLPEETDDAVDGR
jgi:putative CocE/NonD family hydrolase